MHKWITTTLLILALSLLAACSSSAPPPMPTSPPLAQVLVFYARSGDLIENVFDDFGEEYGVQITYVTYASPEEAVASMRAGEVYDVVVMENQYVPALIAEDLLAEIDYRNVPNFNNISANFRDLVYDPGNKHSIPYSWGTTGLVVRSDLAAQPPSHWLDLWEPRYAGQIAMWDLPRYTLGATLKSLGYSANSEDPVELEVALNHLLALKPNATWLSEEDTSAYLLVSGEVVMALGWAYDVWVGQKENEDVEYILPREGAILWGDNFVIPANSSRKYTAELFLNFILRPEISGQIINENYQPMANGAANSYVDPEILNDPVVYPRNQDLENAEILLPLSLKGEDLYADIWERFMAGGQ
jgi:spermidine/putrescine transport system substrate-binding protein